MMNNKMLVRLNIQVNTLTDVGITIIESKKNDYLKFLSNVYEEFFKIYWKNITSLGKLEIEYERSLLFYFYVLYFTSSMPRTLK